MVEHTVIIDNVGGAIVLSCEALNIKNVEFPFTEVNGENVKKTILDYKYLTEEQADFDLKVVDNRPEPEDYNKKKERESKEFKESHNKLI